MKNIFLILIASILIPSFALAQNASKKAVWLNIPAIAFGSVTAGFTTFATLTKPIDLFDIVNLTDAAIICTDDNAVDKWPVPAYAVFSPDLGETFSYLSGIIYCKRLSAAPTVGSVYFNAGY